MTIEVSIPKYIKEALRGLSMQQMQLVLHSYLVTGVLPAGVIAKMLESNGAHHSEVEKLPGREPIYLWLVEAGGS